MKSYQIKTEDYLDKLREVYVPAVNEPEPWRAVRWGSHKLQINRLITMEEFIKPCDSVLDVGCGRGHLAWCLFTSGHDAEYLGIDLVSEYIGAALNNRYGSISLKDHPCRFEVHDLRDEPRPADVVIASGTFTISNDEIFWSMLDAMWESAGKIMAFNCKSTWAPEECASAGGISYLRDPAETLTECRKRYTRDLVLRHDYLDHDFTIAAYK